MREETLIIELHYLPSIQYFVYLNSFEKIIIDLTDKYVKQTYRNRCSINGANKVEDLIIPIKKSSKNRIYTAEMEIDHNQKWLGKHQRAIQSAYGKAPFFEYYAHDFFEIVNKKQNSLLDLNKELLTKCLEFLGMNLSLKFSSINFISDKNGYYDARNDINPKTPIIKNSIFSAEKYFQVFGNNFVNNLSVVDLIFCEGPQARQIIEKSCPTEQKKY